jgi:hypothetical protein
VKDQGVNWDAAQFLSLSFSSRALTRKRFGGCAANRTPKISFFIPGSDKAFDFVKALALALGWIDHRRNTCRLFFLFIALIGLLLLFLFFVLRTLITHGGSPL